MDKKKKILIYSLIALCFVNVLIILTAYAFWQTDKKQTKKNVAASACLKITFEEDASSAIALLDAYPTSDEDGMASSGYNYSVVNTCDHDVAYQIVLESLPTPQDSYIDYHDIKLQYDGGLLYRYDELADEDNDPDANYDIRHTKHLFNSVVSGGATNNHNLKIWLASDASLDNQGKTFSGRVKIYAGDVNINEQDKYAADSCFTTSNYSGGILTITDFDFETCSTNSLVIPSSIDGSPIKGVNILKTDIDSSSYPKIPLNYFFDSLEYLDISNMTSLVYIYGNSFISYKGSNQELIIPDSVTFIGDKAFGHFVGSNLILGQNVETIRFYAFYNYKGENRELIIPSSVRTIGNSAFYAYRGSGLTLSEGISSIGNSTFNKYVGTGKNLVIPNSVSNLGNSAFYNFNGTNLVISDGLDRINGYTFYRYNGSNLLIPPNVQYIDVNAFYNYQGINKSLVIPDKTMEIGYSNINNLDFPFFESHYLSGETDYQMSGYSKISDFGTFYSFNGSDLKLGNDLKTIWLNTFKSYVGSGKDLTIPNSTEKIGSGAFRSFNGNNLTIGDSVQYIGHEAFYSYVGANKTINIPNTITAIGQDAFKSLASSATIVVDKPNLDGLTLGENWYGNAHIKCKNNNQIIDCPNN